jgi:uncharacterized membrane protein HdeD (DUF308 family)
MVSAVRHELEHLASRWWWFMLLGALLVIGGTLTIVLPPVMVATSIAIPVVLGVILRVEGAAMIVSSFWAGKWSAFLLELLVGLLYVACAFLFMENPEIATVTLTYFIAVTFIVLGVFRAIAALVLQFPQWGWALLNGVVTLVAGLVIYRNLPEAALWVIGLLVGLELLLHGWTWIMLSLALRKIHALAA